MLLPVLQPGELLLVLGLRLGEGGFEALDLAAQQFQLRRVGLDGERRIRARLGLCGRFLGLDVRGLLRSDLQRLGFGLDRLGFLDLGDFHNLLDL